MTAKPTASPVNPTTERLDRPGRAIAALVLATFLFAISDTGAKYLTQTLPAVQVTWLRYVIFGAMVLPLALRHPGALKSAMPGLQVLRGLGLGLSALLFILSVSALPVAEATALNFVAPIFIMILAMLFLREQISLSRWVVAVIGLVGVIIIVQPGTDAFTPAVAFPLGAAAVWACSAIITRKMSSESTLTTMLYTAIVGLVFLSLIVPFQWVTPSWPEWGIAVIVGALATVANWGLVYSYQNAPASLLAPFHYVQLIFASACGYLAFGAVPTFWTVCGAVIIAMGGLYNARNEQQARALAASEVA